MLDDSYVDKDAFAFSQPNPSDYPGVVCDKCGSRLFVAAAAMKALSGIALGVGSETVNIPVFKTFVCSSCGEVIASDREIWEACKNSLEKEDEKLSSVNDPKPSIILP